MPTRSEREAPAGEEFKLRARVAGLPPAEVRELSALSAWRASASLAWSWLLTAAGVAAAVMWWHPAVIAAALLVIAGGQHGLAVLAHEAAHYRLYRTRWLNDAAGRLCGWPLGVSLITYRVIHRIHHNHLYEPIDPDLALMAGYPRGRLYLARKLLKDLLGLTTIKNYRYFIGKPQGVARADDTSPALRAAARRDRRLVSLVQLVLLGGAAAIGVLDAYLLLWLLPLVTLLQAILRLRAICEHGAITDTSTPLRAARTTVAPALWLRWFMFPHDVQFHIEPHLYPSIPHYRLPECHRRLVTAGALAGAEVRPDLRSTLALIWTAPQNH
jgi:fatty acid desaturase